MWSVLGGGDGDDGGGGDGDGSGGCDGGAGGGAVMSVFS